MKFKKGKKRPTKHGGGGSKGFLTNIQKRKLKRKEDRQSKKIKRVAFAQRGKLQSNNDEKEGNHGEDNRIDKLKAFVEAEKSKIRMNNNNMKSEKLDKKKDQNKKTKKLKVAKVGETEETGGFKMTSSNSDRFAKLQEFVNQEVKKSGNNVDSNTKIKSEEDDDKKTKSGTLIKDKNKVKNLRDDQDKDDKEIKKLAKLLKRKGNNKAKLDPVFADDYEGLLEDIEGGTLNYKDKYEVRDLGIKRDSESEDDFDKDLATALGKEAVSKSTSKVTKEKTIKKVKQSKNKKKKNNLEDVDDDDEDFLNKEFGAFEEGGSISGSDDYDEMEDGEKETVSKSTSKKVKEKTFKKVKQSKIKKKKINLEDVDDDDEDFLNKEFGAFEEGGSISGSDDYDEMEDGEEEEYEYEMDEADYEPDDATKYNTKRNGIVTTDMDKKPPATTPEDDWESCDSYYGSDDESEEEDKKFLDDEAEEDRERYSDEDESEEDPDRSHDELDEHELAFQAGRSTGGCSKPEILKSGQVNDIDNYSSDSQDDTDLSDFVVDDMEDVEYDSSQSGDELPEEDEYWDESGQCLLDTSDIVKKKKRKRLVVEDSSDDDKEEKKSRKQKNPRKRVLSDSSDDDDDDALSSKYKAKKAKAVVSSDDESQSDNGDCAENSKTKKTKKKSESVEENDSKKKSVKLKKKSDMKNKIIDESDEDEDSNECSSAIEDAESKEVSKKNINVKKKKKKAETETDNSEESEGNNSVHDDSDKINNLNGKDKKFKIPKLKKKKEKKPEVARKQFKKGKENRLESSSDDEDEDSDDTSLIAKRRPIKKKTKNKMEKEIMKNSKKIIVSSSEEENSTEDDENIKQDTADKESCLKKKKNRNKNRNVSFDVPEDEGLDESKRESVFSKKKSNNLTSNDLDPYCDAEFSDDAEDFEDDENEYEEEETEENNKDMEEDSEEKDEDMEEGNFSNDSDVADDLEKISNSKDEDNEYKEDIYGRLRDKDGNIVKAEEKNTSTGSKYIPPALRKLNALNSMSEKKKEQLLALKRQLKGLLNRLAETNMAGIANTIEGMYLKNSRNDMNDTLTSLFFESIVAPSLTPERLVQEHAMLTAILSANVGIEVGAHILNDFVLKWNEDMDKFEPSGSVDTKELDNLLLFIANLYNFKLMDARLLYDILRKMTERFREKEVELILLLLRNVGFTLRKDDPLALKSLITSIQTQASLAQSRSEKSEGGEYSRVCFMLEIVQAIRNNNMTKVPNYDPTHVEHLKKVLKGMIRKGNQISELKISLEDLLNAHERGRWWIVGSAWSGGLVENQQLQTGGGKDDKEGKNTNSQSLENEFSDNFKKRAAKLQLSRPPRINILYIVTEGSEDYLDAFEKLLQLSLPPQQEHEIFSVILICCQKGKVYNPFFAHLTDQLCNFDKKYKGLLRKALYDNFEELPNMKAQDCANMAKFVAHAVGGDSTNLSIFNKIAFMEVDGQMVSFLRQVMIGVLLHPGGSSTMEKCFGQLNASPKLKMLRTSLRIFIIKFLGSKKTKDDNPEHQLLLKRIEKATEILSSGGSVLL